MKDKKMAYCGSCEKDTLFKFLGKQEIPLKKKKLNLYNCTICNSTRAL